MQLHELTHEIGTLVIAAVGHQRLSNIYGLYIRVTSLHHIYID